jgi:death-on-curing protein
MTEYLTIDQVIKIHDELLSRHGGLLGIRDINLLWSAIDAPKVSLFGQEMYPTVFEKAAAYLYHLTCNHPFNDANKRTALGVTIIFLALNNEPMFFHIEELEWLVVEVAKGTETKERIATFLRTGYLLDPIEHL